MTDAAFKACYAEWKVIKTRATVQLVFELPIERADEAYQALGGMPIAAHEVWCGIARLDLSKEQAPPPHPAEATPRPAHAPQPLPVGENKQKRPFGEMAPSQQAGMLCHDLVFQKFLSEEHPDRWVELRARKPSEPLSDRAKAIVYQICKVTSRAQIDADNADWSALVLAYRLWQRHPELSEA